MTDRNLKLKPEIKAEWLRRLRSGDYVQMKGSLGRTMPDGECRRCCLGVLVEVPGVQAQLDLLPLGYGGEVETFSLIDGGEEGVPMGSTMLSAFLVPEDEPGDSPRIIRAAKAEILTEDDCLFGLTILNDDENWTFAQIADLIEKYW